MWNKLSIGVLGLALAVAIAGYVDPPAAAEAQHRNAIPAASNACLDAGFACVASGTLCMERGGIVVRTLQCGNGIPGVCCSI